MRVCNILILLSITLLFFCSPTTEIHAQTVTYTGNFVNGQSTPSSSTVCQDWNTFRAALNATPGTYNEINMGNGSTTLFSCNDQTSVDGLAVALKNNSTFNSGSGSCSSWRIGVCGGGPEISTNGGICNCNAGGIIRPCIGNANWGGQTLTTCGAPSQTMTLTFTVSGPPPTIANDDADGDGTPDIMDPCSCTDPMNPPATVTGPGGGTLFHEVVTVTSGTGQSWEMDATTVGALDATGAPLVLPAAMTESSPGVYTLDFYHEINVGYTGDFSNGGSTLSIANTCTLACSSVPTLSEWGLIILALLLLNTALLFVMRKRREKNYSLA